MDWTEGYVADIAYTHGYYKELNPHWIKLALLNAGLAVPDITTACELGFGQGISVNIHAAASTTQWHGTDFNPTQAAFANELAALAAPAFPAQLSDQGFAEFCARDDLPQFDYIGLHGIWSWISDANRTVIVDFLQRRLKVGGVLYISYNTHPGWAPVAPLRHLLVQHAEVMGKPGEGSVARIKNALEFTEKLLATNPLYSRINPELAARLEKMKGQNPHYLVHEYFNRDWEPMHFSEMAEWLTPAKLSYACPAAYNAHVDVLNLTPDQGAFLRAIPDPGFRETLRDFIQNKQFRKDFWIKGPRSLSALERREALQALPLVLSVPRASVPDKVAAVLGEVQLKPEVYGPILDFLADHRVRTVGAIAQAMESHKIPLEQLVEALLLLTDIGAISTVQTPTAAVTQASARLNLKLMRMARSSGENIALASPVTGGGVVVGRFEQLFLLARTQGGATPQAWAEATWQILRSQGQRIAKDGKTLNEDEENLSELLKQAESFATQRLPLLIALGVAAAAA